MRLHNMNTIHGFTYTIILRELVMVVTNIKVESPYVIIHDCFGYVKTFNEDAIDAMHFVNPDAQPIKVGFFSGRDGITDTLYFNGNIILAN